MSEDRSNKLTLREITNESEWDALVVGLPGAHFLQSWAWGEIKSVTSWQAQRLAWFFENGGLAAAACLLTRHIRFGPLHAAVCYLPRGPLLDWQNQDLREAVLADVRQMARKNGAIFVKMDAELVTATGIPGEDGQDVPAAQQTVAWLMANGWRHSTEQIQFRNTVWLHLDGGEENWLARMKQKTRYNIRLAEKKGVAVRQASPQDWPTLYRMYAETAVRDGFVVRPESYYNRVWDQFHQRGMLNALIAEVEGEAVAGLVQIRYGQRAWYLYGMSRAAHREKMPNYLLQWQAMLLAAQAGCRVYDLWGAPDQFNEDDRLQGVFRFKQGLGGQVIHTPGALDYVLRPFMYWLYTRLLPAVLNLMRRRGQARNQQEINA